ncbi:MAG: hypothetical protein Q8O14_11460 [bacterium]|jgi:hypothetical protein|nr:hypothetical protein [bacterium]
MMKLLSRIPTLAVLAALAAQPASALVEQSYLQWQESGDTVPNSSDVRVYARALKTDCTGICDPPTDCESMTKTLFYRAEGETQYTSLAMELNTGDCYTPLSEYFADIPVSSLTGSIVEFYCEFADGDGVAPFTARPGSPGATFTAESPAYYLVQDATSDDFVLQVTGDFHCVTPNGPGPGISGSFNGWTYQAMTPAGGGLYTYDIQWPAGSASTIEFKFRNGTNWESLAGGPFANREYEVAPGATVDNYFGYWSNQEICPCDEHALNAQQQVVFQVDMTQQDPASYAGGVSIQGSTAPLNWDAGSRPMNDFNQDGIYTLTVTFPAGTINTTEFKFTRNDGSGWSWEDTPNRFLCMADNGFQLLTPVYWNNFQAPQATTVDIEVLFAVDVRCLDGVLGVSVQGGTSPLDWTSGSTSLTDANLDGVWEGAVVFPAGSPFDVEYKFTHTTDGTNWEWEDSIGNRALVLSDEQPQVTLPVAAWDEWFCAPELAISYAGGQVTLQWSAVPTATSYNVYSSINGYPELNLETNTAATSIALPVAGAKYFEVRAVK